MSENNVLELRLVKVHCVDETNPEPLGSDEMRLSGVVTDPGGNTFKLPIIDIGSFDDGEWRTSSLTVAKFDLSKGEGWPKGCVITLVLAEEDLGKLSSFVNKLLEKAQAKVTELLSALAGAAIGAAIGSPLGPATALVGAAVGAGVSELVKVLKEWFEDDLFKPVTLQFDVPSPDTEIKSEQMVWWKGHGGHYELFFEWVKLGGTQPHHQWRYNAVWNRDSAAQRTSAWIAGWEIEHFKGKNNEFHQQGYYLTDLQAVDIGGGNWRYNAVWNHDSAAQRTSTWIAGWEIEHFKGKNNELHQQGYYLTDLQVVDIGGGNWRYNAVWNHDSVAQRTSTWIAGWELGHFQGKNNELHQQGYYLTSLEVYNLV